MSWLCAGLARLLVDASVVSRSSVNAEDTARKEGAIQEISSTPGRMVARVANGRVWFRKDWMKEAGRKYAGWRTASE